MGGGEGKVIEECQFRFQHERWWKKTTPISRYGEPFEIATAIKFLASDEASFITGTSMVVDGGWSIASVGMDQI